MREKKCKPALLWLAGLVFRVTPPTRLFRLKCILLSISGVDIKPSVRLCSSVKIAISGHLEIGAETFIGHEVLITGGDSRIRVGNAVDIGPRVCIVSGTHHVDMVGERSAGEGISKDITIEDGVWIGTGATILGGVTVGRKSVIAAGSVVNESIPSFVIAAGVPCRPIRQWDPHSNAWDTVASHEEAAEVQCALCRPR